MSLPAKTAFVGAAALSLGTALWLAPEAFAGASPSWNGHYAVTLAANAKSGTSVAANGREFARQGNYLFSSSCSGGVCVATVNNPPPPENGSMPRTIQYTWNGSQWVREMSWKWDCVLPNGAIEYDPAKSITTYTPGPNGVLNGVFHTDIFSGACKGNVDVPVQAAPSTSIV